MADDEANPDEEALVSTFFAPLAAGYPGALDLKDDCALIEPAPGSDLVVTTDAIAEGVDFLPGACAADVGWKALAVNVSDLAAKGARPVAYLMALSFPQAPGRDWLAAFTTGLSQAQKAFGINLAGGDIDRRPGPLSATVTAFGSVAHGTMVPRTRAQAGDRLFVSGTLGDAALGLDLRRSPQLAASWSLTPEEGAHLVARYDRPQPRLALRQALLAHARAAMDVSDGLVKDLSRMCAASQSGNPLGAILEAARLPLSPAATKAIAADPGLTRAALAWGDDYEVLAAVPPHAARAFADQALADGCPVCEIGWITAQPGVHVVGTDGQPIALARTGWDHF